MKPKLKGKKSKKSKRNEKLNASLILALPVYVLNEEYGWGSKSRLPGFAEKMVEVIEKIESGELDPKEIQDRFEEMTGMKII